MKSGILWLIFLVSQVKTVVDMKDALLAKTTYTKPETPAILRKSYD
jgi:hypothetical protein